MKAKDVVIGQIYNCRVSGQLRQVRVEREYINWQDRTRFDALNLATNRKIVVSAARLRPPVIKPCGCQKCGHRSRATCRGLGCACCGCAIKTAKQAVEAIVSPNAPEPAPMPSSVRSTKILWSAEPAWNESRANLDVIDEKDVFRFTPETPAQQAERNKVFDVSDIDPGFEARTIGAARFR